MLALAAALFVVGFPSASERIALRRLYEATDGKHWNSWCKNKWLEDAAEEQGACPVPTYSGLQHCKDNGKVVTRTRASAGGWSHP